MADGKPRRIEASPFIKSPEMRLFKSIKTTSAAVLLVLAVALIGACGGGGGSTAPVDTDSTTSAVTTAVTTVKIVTPAAAPATQANVPITFGQTFRPGDVPASNTMVLTLANGTVLPYQVDVKARNADGSLRHGIFSIELPALQAGQPQTITLSRTETPISAGSGTSPAALLAAGFTASVNLNIGGTMYTASADSLLASNSYKTWLSGPLVNEWLVSAPVKTAGGLAHPHLTARFAIRSYTGINKARVDVTIENNWAYETGPQNFTYDAQILVGGHSVYSKAGLTHYHHARWRKVFWWGGSPAADVKHDIAYLIASKAVPGYDQSIQISSSALTTLKTNWDDSNLPPTGTNNDVIDMSSADQIDASNVEPMWSGIVYPRMSNVGGRPDIGPFPQWAAVYLLSMDSDAKAVTLGIGDSAGSWPVHYRDKTTDLPVSLIDHPYMTILGHPGDAINPVTHQNDYFPACGGNCSAPIPATKFRPTLPSATCLTAPTTTPGCWYEPESAHEPSMAYLPYLVTGDYYYLEELQFWANWNIFQSNPYYRGFEKGLVRNEQVRGQAWTLRTLGQVAYITPDTDPMKQYFVDRVGDNLAFYNQTYSNGNPNQLGVLDGSGDHGFAAVAYFTPASTTDRTGIAPWQDDFFTWTVGSLVDLGFTDARPLLAWKAKFPVGRMMGPGYCWIDGATYSLAVRPTAASPLYSTLAEAYQSTMRASDGSPLVNSTGARYLDQSCGSQAQADWRTQYDQDNHTARGPWMAGEMTGYATSVEGFPSNMQPALAVAATSGIPDAQAAWDRFINRPIKPDYSSAPQFAIVPRN
jgi:hypothetical protein